MFLGHKLLTFDGADDPPPPIVVHGEPADCAKLPEEVPKMLDPQFPSYQEKWFLPEEDRQLYSKVRLWASAASGDAKLFFWPLDGDQDTPPCVRIVEAQTDIITDYFVDWDRMISASVGIDNSFSLFDIESNRKLLKVRNDSGKATSKAWLCMDGDLAVGKALIGDASGDVKLLDLTVGKTLFRMVQPQIRGKLRSVRGLKVDWDLNQAVSCGWDQTVSIYDIRVGRKVRAMRGHGAICNRIEVGFDMQLALSCAWEHQMLLWDLKSGEVIKTYPSHRANDVRVDWERMIAASAGDEGTCKLWDLETGECTRTIDTGMKSQESVDVDWDRGYLLTTSCESNFQVQLFSLHTGEHMKMFKKPRRICNRCHLQKRPRN